MAQCINLILGINMRHENIDNVINEWVLNNPTKNTKFTAEFDALTEQDKVKKVRNLEIAGKALLAKTIKYCDGGK